MSLRCGAALWAFILLAPAEADAGDYHLQDFPVGNRAMVLGGAFTAMGNDPSGVYYNPAGLVDASRANVSVSASLYGLDRLEVASLGEGSRGFGGPRVTTRYRLVPGEVGAVFTSDWDRQGKRAPLAMAFTVLFPSAGERSLVSTAHRFEDSGFTRVRDTSEAVRTISDAELWLGAGVGYALNDTFSIGASAFILHRTVSLSSQASWTFRPDDYVDWFQDRDGYQPDLQFYDSVAQLDANDQSVVGVLGAKMRFEPMLVGLQVRLPGIPFRSRAKVSRRLFSTYNPAGQEDVVQAELAEDPSGLRSETRRSAAVRFGAAWIQDKTFTASCDLTYELPSRHRRWYFDDERTEEVFQLPGTSTASWSRTSRAGSSSCSARACPARSGCSPIKAPCRTA